MNMLNKMLKNRAYIGEYHHGDIVVEGGMPVLVDKATFDRAQRRFAENKRKGSQRAHGMDDAEAPRYWLTGKLYCGECGSTMQGVSGTSKTGRTYYVLLLLLLRPAQERVPPAQGPQAGLRGHGAVRPAQHR